MKREAGYPVGGSEDKKARWEAGLDLDLSRIELVLNIKSQFPRSVSFL